MKPLRQQFERMALEQMDLLYRFARRLVKDPARAEDLVQETYLRALRSRETFDLKEHGIRPWMLRILHNLHLSTGEREQKQPAAVDAEQLDVLSGHDVDLPIDPASVEAMDQRLVRALDRLPEDYRSVLVLWAVEDFAYREIAEALQIPIGTVMSRLHRARHRLAAELKDVAAEAGILRE